MMTETRRTGLLWGAGEQALLLIIETILAWNVQGLNDSRKRNVIKWVSKQVEARSGLLPRNQD